MVQQQRYRRFTVWSILITIVLSVLFLNVVTAQDTIPIDPDTGTAVFGTIDAENPSITYSFEGNAADVVTIRAIGLTTGADPNLALLSPTSVLLATNETDIFLPFGTAAEITSRLDETGTHQIVVSGTPGDFIMTVNFRPVIAISSIEYDTPITVTAASEQNSHVFMFINEPSRTSSLMIDVNTPLSGTQIEIRNTLGDAIATFHSGLYDTCISFPPDDEIYEIIVVSEEEATEDFILNLRDAPCLQTESDTAATQVPPAQFTPVAIEGVCALSSPGNINIRSGAGMTFAVVAILPAFQPIQAIGQNADGSWFAVQNSFVQGWISANVVGQAGPCDALPVIPAQVTPTATLTATATGEVTAEPTEEVTAEPTAEVTEEPEPTGEVTEEPVPTEEGTEESAP